MSAEVEGEVGQMILISAVIGFYNICLNKLKELAIPVYYWTYRGPQWVSRIKYNWHRIEDTCNGVIVTATHLLTAASDLNVDCDTH